MSMDFQAQVDAMSNIARSDRAKYHVTLAGLIDLLKLSYEHTPVHVSQKGEVMGSVGALASYRGYYADLAFEPVISIYSTVGEVLGLCEHALDSEFIGHKGGEFLMGGDTPLWIADHGCMTNMAIVDATVANMGLVLHVKDLS